MGKSNEFKVVYLDHKTLRWIYFIFQSLIIITMIGSILSIIINPENIENQITHIFLCIIAILVFNIPLLLKTKYKIYIPSVIQGIALVLFYCHFILGEIYRLFDYSIIFDKALHTISGVAITICGYSLINLLNKSDKAYIKLSPFFVVLFSFCFALSIALLWELFEFFVDSIIGSNMQRWQLDEATLQSQKYDLGRFGLIDTMIDIVVSTIGSLIVSIIGYISLKSKRDILNRVMFRRIVDYDKTLENAKCIGDYRLIEMLEKAKHSQENKQKK